MNANMVHNFLNIAGFIFAAFLTYDWTSLGFTAEQAVVIAGWVLLGDKVIKLGMNIVRDGPGGLFKVQPPVKD